MRKKKNRINERNEDKASEAASIVSNQIQWKQNQTKRGAEETFKESTKTREKKRMRQYVQHVAHVILPL